jgi:hypothetical protein
MTTATEKLSDTYENYTRLIQEITEQNKELKKMIKCTDDEKEKLEYLNAMILNDRAINKVATERLQMTAQVFCL